MRVLLTAGVLLLAGCGAPAGTTATVERTATDFLTAVEGEDGARACELIAPETRLQLEKQERKPCEEAVLSSDLPETGAVSSTEVFSNEAVVVTSSQTVFVSHFDAGWRVTAAGCRPRGDKPYDCEVQGA